MLNFKPTPEDLELRQRTEERLQAARQAMGSNHLLHPANAMQKKSGK